MWKVHDIMIIEEKAFQQISSEKKLANGRVFRAKNDIFYVFMLINFYRHFFKKNQGIVMLYRSPKFEHLIPIDSKNIEEQVKSEN